MRGTETALKIVITITMIELVLVFVASILIIFTRIYMGYRKKRYDRIRKEITSYFFQSLEKNANPNAFVLPRRLRNLRALLTVIEDIDETIKEANWLVLKEMIIKRYLFPKARYSAKSLRWMRRNLAARTFALFPTKEDEDSILYLVSDKVPLNRIFAARAAIALATPTLLRRLFDMMVLEPVKNLFNLRDIVVNGSEIVYQWMQKELKRETDINMRFIYLDIFSAKKGYTIRQLIDLDLKSDVKYLREKAVQILIQFPTKEDLPLLKPFLKDPSEDIRAHVAKALGNLVGESAFEELKGALQDESFWVRMQAAISLRRLGKIGVDYLNQVGDNPDMRGIVDYALTVSDRELQE